MTRITGVISVRRTGDPLPDRPQLKQHSQRPDLPIVPGVLRIRSLSKVVDSAGLQALTPGQDRQAVAADVVLDKRPFEVPPRQPELLEDRPVKLERRDVFVNQVLEGSASGLLGRLIRGMPAIGKERPVDQNRPTLLWRAISSETTCPD